MCNLYSLTKSQDAMRRLFRFRRDLTGNLPPLPGIFPDGMAPVIRTGPDGERELAMLRWGMPCPPAYGAQAITNIRNTKSPHWRAWLGPKNRCLVPFTSFCEYADTKPRKTPTWFAGDESRPLLAFAGIWTTWRGTSGLRPTRSRASTTFSASSQLRRTRSWRRSTARRCRSSCAMRRSSRGG